MKKLFFIPALLSAMILSGLNFADYGAGPMLKPARTFYVSTKGNNKNDGKTLKTAFRTIGHGAAQLKAGDTLLIEGGDYFEREIQLNVKENTINYQAQCGKPGSPIRIMGMKGKTPVILHGSDRLPLGRKEGNVYKFKYGKNLIYNMVQEYPSGIELQRVYNEKLVHEFPGTFFYDQAKQLLLVHLTSLGQTHVAPAVHRIGIRIHGSYIHIENLQFRSFYEGIYCRMNEPYEKNHARNITIKNCLFHHNFKNGLVFQGASWSLAQNNRFYANIEHGGLMTQRESHDNLILGNWCGYTTRTKRQCKPNAYDYGINNYGGNPPRNHVIGNYFDTPLAFRWKAGCPDSIIRDNVFNGAFYAESAQVPATITNNLFLGNIGWSALGHGLWEKEFAPTKMKFYGNFKTPEKFKPATPELEKAKSLALKLPVIKFPSVTFKDLRVRFTTTDSAVLSWETPGCDGWGEAVLFDAKGRKVRSFASGVQAVRHLVGISGLKPGSTYQVKAKFLNRRGGEALSAMTTFKTPLTDRAPAVLEVGPGKYTIEETACAAIPGDTVKLLPGTHYGTFSPVRSGKPGKPITLLGKGAVLDGMQFYAPMITLQNKSHIIIDGVTFANPESTARKGIIRTEGGSHITIRNCYARHFGWLAGGFITARNTPYTLIENNIIHGGDYPIATVGKNIKIKRNTIIDGTMMCLSIWNPDDLEITDNIFYRPCVPEKRNPAMTINDIKGKIICEGNVYFSPVKEHTAGGRIRDHRGMILKESKTLEEWQKISGFDKKGFAVDPQFVDYAKGDFRLKPGSPVKNKGAKL